MNLTQIHSITKKICVALLGGFLLIFVLFHAAANLCILRNDDGAWYSAFCHFMGTNYIVKVVEVCLLLIILLHICLTIWLWWTNRQARGPVRYKHASRTKTHAGSKLMIWTGVLLLVALICHFCDFYFVKMDIVKGQYMTKTEEINKMSQKEEFGTLVQLSQMMHKAPKEVVEDMKAEDPQMAESMGRFIPVLDFVDKVRNDGEMLTQDGKWIKNINKDDQEVLNNAGIEVEPDFYAMAREKFKNPIIAILYLLFFVVLYIHMRHAFPSAFQTLGLNNYTYNKALDVIGIIYAVVVCLMFAATVLGVLFLV